MTLPDRAEPVRRGGRSAHEAWNQSNGCPRPSARSWLIPGAALGLALLWLVAQAFESPAPAALACVLTLWAAAAGAASQRRGAGFQLLLAAMMLVVAGFLVLQLMLRHAGSLPLLVDLGLVLLLGPLAPLIYARTFPVERRSPAPPDNQQEPVAESTPARQGPAVDQP